MNLSRKNEFKEMNSREISKLQEQPSQALPEDLSQTSKMLTRLVQQTVQKQVQSQVQSQLEQLLPQLKVTVQVDPTAISQAVEDGISPLLQDLNGLIQDFSTQIQTLNAAVSDSLKNESDAMSNLKEEQRQLRSMTDALLGAPEQTGSDSNSTQAGSTTSWANGGALSSLMTSLETLNGFLDSIPSKSQLAMLSQNLGQLLQAIDQLQEKTR